MSDKSEDNAIRSFKLPDADAAELRSSQSVRATFKLSENTILALNIISNQLGVKQKSLFDHLIADTEALEKIARGLKRINQENPGGIQKTFVMSRRTLSILQQMAEDYQAPRDALVEFSIQRLKPIIEQEKQKREIRKKFVAEIKHQLRQQQALLQEVHAQLGIDDPISEKLERVAAVHENAYTFLKEFIRRGEKLSEL